MRHRVGVGGGSGTINSTSGWRQAPGAAAGGGRKGDPSSEGSGPGIRSPNTGTGHHAELAREVWYRIEDVFFGLDGKTLALILSGGALALMLLVGAVVMVVWTRRRRRKPFDLHHLDDSTEPVTVQSAPGSRSPSPKMPKRLSCPDALSHAKRGSGGMVVRSSMTVGMIPDFTLPPERVQPRASGDRGGGGGGGGPGGASGGGPGGSSGSCTTALQYQQSLIGSLQPDLYSHSSSFSEEDDNYLPMSTYGRLWYSIVYDAAVEQLNVTLIKVKDLPGRGPHHHPRDPFVKVFLLPDDRVCRTSKVRKKTLSPVFNENFVFQVTSEDIKNRVLRFSVYDVDKKKVRHSLGHVMIPLRDVDLGHVDTYWSDLESMPQALSASLGDLELSLCYLPQTEKIKVGIMRARNLKHTDMDIDTRTYLRLQLFYGRKVHRTKRTGSRPGSLDIAINESLSFSVSGKQLESCRLEIALMMTSQRMLTHDVEYGRVVIGPFMYARGEELIHWQEIMAQPRSVITRWHSLTASPTHD